MEFARKHYSSHELRKANVLCLSGAEMLEVKEVYDQLGVKRSNITTLEDNPNEFFKLEERNNSLNLEGRINAIPKSVFEYFRDANVKKYDIISLDYCGYFNQEKADILTLLAIRGWLNDKGILITNYQMGRENMPTQGDFRFSGFVTHNYQDILSSDLIGFINLAKENQNFRDEDSRLSHLRDRFVQGTPIRAMIIGSGFWNTPFFRAFVESSKTGQETMNNFRDYLNLKSDFLDKEALNSLTFRKLGEYSIFGWYFINLEARSHHMKYHEAYKYVSDSGTPMISDLYYFKVYRPNPPHELRGGLKYELKNNVLMIKKTISDSKLVRLIEWIKNEDEKMKSIVKQYDDSIPLERVLLKPESRMETEDESMQDALINPNAAYSTVQATKSTTRNKIEPHDKEIIIEFLSEGYNSNDILGLFEGRYTLYQIAGIKASLTKSKGDNPNSTRQIILERDEDKCQYCTTTQEENIKKSGHGLHIHHIDYNHNNNALENMIALCTSCHVKTNTVQHAEEMRKVLEVKIIEKYK